MSAVFEQELHPNGLVFGRNAYEAAPQRDPIQGERVVAHHHNSRRIQCACGRTYRWRQRQITWACACLTLHVRGGAR